MEIATYNIMSGGFVDYTYEYHRPERINLLQQAIKQIGADFIGLIDTFRWKDIYSNEDLQKLFGYKTAFHINMDATEVDPQIGLAILTNLNIKDCQIVRLATRNGIKTTATVEGQDIDIYTIYLHHADEDLRLKQAQSLVDQLGKNPSIIIGDFNSIPHEKRELLKQAFEEAFKSNPDFTKKAGFETYIKPRIENYCRGEVLPLFQSYGLTRAFDQSLEHTSSFTALASHEFPSPDFNSNDFQVDHILYSLGLRFDRLGSLAGGVFDEASDHYPIKAKFI